MTTRVLPAEEWSRLDGTLLDPAYHALNPATTRVIVVEQDGQILACTALFLATHLEGTWVNPQVRRQAAVGRALLAALRDQLVTEHVGEVLMMARTPEQRKLCEQGAARLGTVTHLACDHYAVTVGV